MKMRTLIIHSVVVAVFLSLASSANFLVVTKHNLETFLKYRFHNSEHIEHTIDSNSFDSHRLIRYCEQLRKAKIFTLSESDDLSEFGHPHQRSLPHNMTAESLQIERSQIGLQTVKFKFESSDHLLSQLIFQCTDFDGDLKWFIAPAAIPHSAFIFIVQQSIAYVFARQRNNSERMVVPARFVAIADQSATELEYYNVVPTFTKSIQINSVSGRDPLCDLSATLKYRLCAIVAAHIDDLPELDGLTDEFATYRDNWYNLRENPRDGCRPVQVDQIQPKIANSSGLIIEMLRCSVTSHQFGSIMPFYLSLNMLNKTQVMYFKQPLDFNSYSLTHSILQIPLLQHLDKYTGIVI